LTLMYDVTLAGTPVDAGDFALGGTRAQISGGEIKGSQVSLILATPITTEETDVTVACAQGCVTSASGVQSPEVASLTVVNNSTTLSPPRIAGFDFRLNKGDYWQYDWQTSSCSGTCVITLDRPTTIQGITAYPVLFSGSFPPGRTPSWKYVAIDTSRMLGSDDGTTLKDIFNARTGVNAGGGFFCRFADTDVSVAIATSMSTSMSTIRYLDPSVYTLGSTAQTNLASALEEYFAPGIGPAGYIRTYASGGGKSALAINEIMCITAWSSYKGTFPVTFTK
jgi:hypothetical protein